MSKSQAEQAVDAWFAARGWKVFPFQRAVWKAALAGQSGPAAREHRRRQDLRRVVRGAAARREPFAARPHGLRVLWITPMRALAADTQRSLEVSAAGAGRRQPGHDRRLDHRRAHRRHRLGRARAPVEEACRAR
jgi:ATP-dependent Lhr-like helicase